MRRTIMATGLALLLGIMLTAPVQASKWNGVLKLGGIYLDESENSDLSAVQETYNIYDGFNVTKILLNGQFAEKHFLSFNLTEVNLDSRKGYLSYRLPNKVRFSARYDEHRQVFDPDRNVTSRRKDWHTTLGVVANSWLRFDGRYDWQTRTGNRLSFPLGTDSWLGNSYDNTIQRGYIEAVGQTQGRGLAVGYEFTDFADGTFETNDRQGYVVSARAYGNAHYLPWWSHYLRGAIGETKLKNGTGLKWELSSFEYTGMARPWQRVGLKYNFYAGRTEDQSRDMPTDNVRNDFDVIYYSQYGRIYGGYGYIINDDDRSITSYDVWRLGLNGGYQKYITVRFDWQSRTKTDQEKRTLLKDLEDSRIRLNLRSVYKFVTVGVGYLDRTREFTDISVKSEGTRVSGFLELRDDTWGAIVADYARMDETYTNLWAPFETQTDIVTGRVDFEYVTDLRLSAGTSYLKIAKDLDIEKSIIFFEGEYVFLDDWSVDFKYNVYNYDDFILVDRFYTANVVWFNVGYRFSVE